MLSAKSIDKNSPTPLYFQLKQLLLEDIAEENLSTDAPIPSEKELIDMFGLSRTTVRQALQELTQEGVLYKIKGKGTFLAHPKDNQSFIQHLVPFDDHIRELGKTPRTEILSCEVVPLPSSVAKELGLTQKKKAIELIRVRFADNEPVCLIHTYLPYDKCACLLEDGVDLRHLYVSMAAHPDLKIRKVVQSVEAIAADPTDAQYLKVPRRCPIQLINITGYNSNDEPLEYSISHFRGDRNKFQCVALVGE